MAYAENIQYICVKRYCIVAHLLAKHFKNYHLLKLSAFVFTQQMISTVFCLYQNINDLTHLTLFFLSTDSLSI